MKILILGGPKFLGYHLIEAAQARGDSEAELRHRVLLAEARQAQGRYADAAESLSRAIELAEASEDIRRLAAVRGALGNVLVALGIENVHIDSRCCGKNHQDRRAVEHVAGGHLLATRLQNRSRTIVRVG